MNREYRICTNCVMDTSDSKIVFDDDGMCDHCQNFYENTEPNWHTDEKGLLQLEQMTERIRKEGKGKDFDCIMGMSGGADSSYLAHVVAAELGLRPLVFHVDAGWNTQEAVNNIERVVEGLGLDLFTEVINWEEMRDLQLAFFRSGVPHLDIPQDHAFFATMYDFAEEHGIKTILTGANYATECVKNPKEWIYFGTDTRQIRAIHREFGERPLRTFPFSHILRHKVYLPFFKGIRVKAPLNYGPYVKSEAIELLERTYGWQSYPQKHFESRFTRFYEGFWLPERFGFDTRRVQFSSLILTGQMTRRDAIEELQSKAYDSSTIDRDFEYIATKLGIPVEELRRYFELPKKTYKDYPNQSWLFDIGSRVMLALGMEMAVKR